jgi:bifunctional DNA-binding transcriptional regulator/antitoxin component of YhaV-PrlF toxin-antitoxin module
MSSVLCSPLQPFPMGHINVLIMGHRCIVLAQGSKELLGLKQRSTRGPGRSHGDAGNSMGHHQSSMHGVSTEPSVRELLSLKTTLSTKMQITIPMKLVKLFNVCPADVVRFTKYETTALTQRLIVELVRGGRRYQTFSVRARPRAIISVTPVGS